MRCVVSGNRVRPACRLALASAALDLSSAAFRASATSGTDQRWFRSRWNWDRYPSLQKTVDSFEAYTKQLHRELLDVRFQVTKWQQSKWDVDTRNEVAARHRVARFL